MKQKLLVTGFGGFVAGSVIAQAELDWDIHAVDRIDVPELQGDVKYYSMDLLDNEKLSKLFKEINPDAVIHTAAIADIDFCQNNQDLAEKVNVGITKALAELCRGNGAKMVVCSTDTVFDGTKGMYAEDDSPNGINFYAETKIKTEEFVKSLDNGVVARLSLVMGLPVMGSGNSFLAKTLEKLKLGESVKFPANEVRTPVDIITLGSALVELAGNKFTGIMHLSGSTKINRYEMACRIAERLEYSKDLIIATDSNEMEGRAPRPNDASLNNSLAKKELNTPMCSLLEGLELTMNYKLEN